LRSHEKTLWYDCPNKLRGQVLVNGFSLWVGIGVGLGLWRVARSAPQQHASTLVNMGLFVLAFALLGARLAYTLLDSAYFSAHLAEIPQIWLGGLAWPGAAAGAWLALLALPQMLRGSRGSRIPFSWIADRLYPLLPPLSTATWLGCWNSGIAYGAALPTGTWWAVPSLDQSGGFNAHVPLQFLAALSLVVFFLLLERLLERYKQPRPTGLLSAIAGAGVLLHLLIASLLRVDPSPHWHNLPSDTWLALALLSGYLLMLLVIQLAARINKKPALPTPT
jgi:prolipoprotein diacylglyceryltransferase